MPGRSRPLYREIEASQLALRESIIEVEQLTRESDRLIRLAHRRGAERAGAASSR